MAKNKPILGILSTIRGQVPLPFAGQSNPFAELLEIARRREITAYVFTKEDVDWENKSVIGWEYRDTPMPEWLRRDFPLPDVIYNRIPSRALETQPAMQEFIELVKSLYGPRFFNPGFLDKWETYNLLAKAKKIGCRLPETRLADSPETVLAMLNKYNDIFLKPRANSLGIGISRITGIPGGGFVCRTLQQDGAVSDTKFSGPEELLASLPIWQKDVQYLAQQTVKRACYQKRPFDIRLLVQKDRCGRWRKTGWAGRVTGPGAVTTHVIYGGERQPVSQILKGRYLTQARAQAKILTAKAPKIIESAWQSSFGELEMDVAVDTAGNLWLLEVNAKPFKFDESLLRTKSLLRLTDYARYLVWYHAGQTGGENHRNPVFIRRAADKSAPCPAHGRP